MGGVRKSHDCYECRMTVVINKIHLWKCSVCEIVWKGGRKP